MEIYTVHIDKKVEIWSRETFYVAASSKEEAVKQAKINQQNEGSDEFEYLVDSEVPLPPTEEATEEILVDDELVYSNKLES